MTFGDDAVDRLCRRLGSRRALLAGAAALGLAPAARPAAARNKTKQPKPCTITTSQELDDALANAKSGGTLRLCAGTFTGHFHVAKRVNLLGDPGGTILDSDGTDRALTLDTGGGTVVSNLTIRGKSAGIGNGGCVYTAVPVTFRNCLLTGGSAQNGGGLYIDSEGAATLEGTVVNKGVAGNEGGGVYNGGRLVVRAGSKIGGSTADGNVSQLGGGLSNNGTAKFAKGTLVTGNRTFSSDLPGGGIYVARSAALRLATKVIVADNTPDNCVGQPGQPIKNCVE